MDQPSAESDNSTVDVRELGVLVGGCTSDVNVVAVRHAAVRGGERTVGSVKLGGKLPASSASGVVWERFHQEHSHTGSFDPCSIIGR